MTDKERLIELLQDCVDENVETDDPYVGFEVKYGSIADHLIANGVTVVDKFATTEQQWISVKDRLPEKDVLVLCIGERGGMFLGRSPWVFSDASAYFDVPNSRRARFATHWMPLPKPPKGE